MERSSYLPPLAALPLLSVAGCGTEISLNAQDEREKENPGTLDIGVVLPPCTQEKVRDPYFFNFEPNLSIPLDEAYFEDEVVFHEKFTDYREEIRGLVAFATGGGDSVFYPVGIEETTTIETFGAGYIESKDGNFEIRSDWGSLANFNGAVVATVLLTDEHCDSLYGLAHYEIDWNPDQQSQSTLLDYYE